MINDYLFEENSSLFTKDTLVFINDTIQFDLKELNKSYLIQKNGVEDYLQYYLKKMKEYKIRSIDSEFKRFGITLEINLKNCQVLYIPNLKAIKNSQWIEFVKKSHKLDEYWYWREY